MTLDTFRTDFMLISHHFEGEQTNEGWIGFETKFAVPTEVDYTFGELFVFDFSLHIISVVFAIRNNALTIDRFHKVTKALF